MKERVSRTLTVVVADGTLMPFTETTGLTLAVLDAMKRLPRGTWKFDLVGKIWHCGTYQHSTLLGLMEAVS
jgi:hypothetical protein